MGQSASQQQVSQQYQVVKVREDSSTLLRNKKTRGEYLLRNINSNIGQQISQLQQLMRIRKGYKSSYLLELIQIKKSQDKNVCSVLYKLHLLIEYPFKTLEDQIKQKIKGGKICPFKEAQLWSVLYSCSVALELLYSKKMPHQSLTANEIYVSRQGFIKISDPLLLGLQKNYIRVLKNGNDNVHVAPQIMNFLDDCNFSFYDKQKSDIFVLGVILLQATLLRSITLYQKQTKKPYLDVIPKALHELKGKYSTGYLSILQKMLQFQSKYRPKFTDIILLIQTDNNLHDDIQTTDETKYNNTNNNKNEYGDKCQKYIKITNNTNTNQFIYRNNSNPNLGYICNNFYNKINFGNSKPNSNLVKKKLQQTPIKMLQNENMHVCQQNFNFQKIGNHQIAKSPYIHVNNIKPNGVPNSPNVINLHQHHHQLQNSSNSLTTTIIKPSISTPTIANPSHSKQFSQTSTNYFPSTRVLDYKYQKPQQNKYPNQTFQLQKTRHLHNYQIPSIQQISKNQNYGHLFVKYPNLPNKYFGQSFHVESVHSSPQNYLTNYCSNPSPHPKMPQRLTQTNPTPKQHPQPQLTIHISQQKSRQRQKNESHIIYKQRSVTNVSRPISRKQSLSSHSIYQTPKSNNTPNRPKIPQLDFGNEDIFKNIYQSSPQDKQIKISPLGIDKKNKQYKVPVNNKIKQKNDKITIFAVTENSEENQENSPKIKIDGVYQHGTLKKYQVSNTGKQKKSVISDNCQKNQVKNNDGQFIKIDIENGGRYEGYIKNGMKNGEGKLEFNDGGYYLGQWKDNKMHGFGKLFYQNGKVAYQGNWQNDQFCGKGRVYNDHPQKFLGTFNFHDFADLGQKWISYEGEFKNDSKNGKGCIKLTNGEVFQGNFMYDSIEGYGTYYNINGDAVKGFWRDNVLVQK